MDPQRHGSATRGRRVLATLFTTLAATALLLTGAPAASAHDALVGVTPADGSSVTTGPDRIELEFSGVVQHLGARVAVRGPDGASVAHGAPEVTDSTLTQPLASGVPAGRYSIDWRVASADGHPISGTTSFTVTAGAAGPQAVQEVSAARPAGSSSSAPWIGVGAAVVLVVALAAGARQLRGRR
jgi:methionine-rich copper-binding protein CopC